MAEAQKEMTVEEQIADAKSKLKQLKAEQKAAAAAAKLERLARRKELLQNDEMPPREGTVSAQIWDFCATHREEHGITPSSGIVKDGLPDLNTHTVQTQTARFRKYVGDVGMSTLSHNPFAPKPPSVEDFEAMSAADQRSTLEKFDVEGDMGNQKKRTALLKGLLSA